MFPGGAVEIGGGGGGSGVVETMGAPVGGAGSGVPGAAGTVVTGGGGGTGVVTTGARGGWSENVKKCSPVGSMRGQPAPPAAAHARRAIQTAAREVRFVFGRNI